ncbi:unnamed protein product [Soboliphyme baturini]|uniref:Uncharacterized protein n=1 Tax=Soboliphyme baturini TaxID=241478 RepID=A0A183IME7_9BILA|nr:unnamed protein product [Soboliphyme baturini]
MEHDKPPRSLVLQLPSFALRPLVGSIQTSQEKGREINHRLPDETDPFGDQRSFALSGTTLPTNASPPPI